MSDRETTLRKSALKDKPRARDEFARYLADELAAEMNLSLLDAPSYTFEETGAAAAWPILLPTPELPGFWRLAMNVEMVGYDPKLSPPYAILERGALDNPEHLSVFHKQQGRWYITAVWPDRIADREKEFFPDLARAAEEYGA